MIFKGHCLQLASRLLIAVLAMFALVWFAIQPGFHSLTVISFSIFALSVLLIWRHINRTNKELNRFLDAARYADFSQRFKFDDMGAGFDELGQTFTEILARQRLMRTSQQQEVPAQVEVTKPAPGTHRDRQSIFQEDGPSRGHMDLDSEQHMNPRLQGMGRAVRLNPAEVSSDARPYVVVSDAARFLELGRSQEIACKDVDLVLAGTALVGADGGGEHDEGFPIVIEIELPPDPREIARAQTGPPVSVPVVQKPLLQEGMIQEFSGNGKAGRRGLSALLLAAIPEVPSSPKAPKVVVC